MKSRVIAISAVSAAFTALLLTLGAYIQLVDLVAVLLTSITVILPLYYKSYLGAVLAYLAGGLLAFMFYGFNIYSIVFPAYFAFFGIFPIVRRIMKDKNFNAYLGFFINLVWFVLVAFGLYFYYTSLMGLTINNIPAWLADYILYALGVIAVIFFVVFDRFVVITQVVVDKYLKRIIK